MEGAEEKGEEVAKRRETSVPTGEKIKENSYTNKLCRSDCKLWQLPVLDH